MAVSIFWSCRVNVRSIAWWVFFTSSGGSGRTCWAWRRFRHRARLSLMASAWVTRAPSCRSEAGAGSQQGGCWDSAKARITWASTRSVLFHLDSGIRCYLSGIDDADPSLVSADQLESSPETVHPGRFHAEMHLLLAGVSVCPPIQRANPSLTVRKPFRLSPRNRQQSPHTKSLCSSSAPLVS